VIVHPDDKTGTPGSLKPFFTSKVQAVLSAGDGNSPVAASYISRHHARDESNQAYKELVVAEAEAHVLILGFLKKIDPQAFANSVIKYLNDIVIFQATTGAMAQKGEFAASLDFQNTPVTQSPR
jgi:hypothetical protein